MIMRVSNIGVLLSGLFMLGCASTGPPAEDGPVVPVYEEGEETPCEYEVMHPIRVSISTTRLGNRDREAVRDRELGLAGAKIGADAVVFPDPGPQKVPFIVGRRSTAGNQMSGTAPVEFQGLAVRWIPETCKR